MKEQPSIPQAVNENIEPEITASPSTIPIPKPHRSGWIVRKPDRFMFLGEAYEAFLEEHESNPFTYEEAMTEIQINGNL